MLQRFLPPTACLCLSGAVSHARRFEVADLHRATFARTWEDLSVAALEGLVSNHLFGVLFSERPEGSCNGHMAWVPPRQDMPWRWWGSAVPCLICDVKPASWFGPNGVDCRSWPFCPSRETLGGLHGRGIGHSRRRCSVKVISVRRRPASEPHRGRGVRMM
jgi:hypothetical protein